MKTSSDRTIFSSIPRCRLKIPWSSEPSGRTIRPEFGAELRNPVNLEQVRADLLCGQTGGDRHQVAGLGDPLLAGESGAVIEQLADGGPVLGLGRADPEEEIHAT